MKKEKLGQEPAFPSQSIGIANGMDKRFYAACAAMQGILASWDSDMSFPDMAKDAPRKQLITTSFAYADELLKQENE